MSRRFDLAMARLGLPLVAGILALVLLPICSPVIAGEDRRVDGHRPVRSLLEIRREGVMIQNWDVSCGAAALGILLKYEFGEAVTEKEIARGLMRRGEYVEHPELVRNREGFSLLDLKRYVQTYGAPSADVYLPKKTKSIGAKVRHLAPAKSRTPPGGARRATSTSAPILGVYRGEGLGQLELNDLIERAPIMVPVDALGYNHFVVFRGVIGDRVLIADPAWGNRTMTIAKFQRMWLDYGEPMGHVGFVVTRADGHKPPNRLRAKLNEFVMLQ
jgi:predicted double-glycine peptidase